MNTVRYWAGISVGLVVGIGIGAALTGRAQTAGQAQADSTPAKPTTEAAENKTSAINRQKLPLLLDPDICIHRDKNGMFPIVTRDGMVLLVTERTGEIAVVNQVGYVGLIHFSSTTKNPFQIDVTLVDLNGKRKHQAIKP